MNTVHIPILLPKIIEFLIEPFRHQPGTYIDCTLGGGGHAAAMMAALRLTSFANEHRVIGVDQDESALMRARQRFDLELQQGRFFLEHRRFSELRIPEGVPPVLGVLADLGFSSDQIETSERGLSFRVDGPLDMRLDQSRGLTAYGLLLRLSERELADLLFEYGEERNSKKIAARIVSAREKGQLFDSTLQFAELVTSCFPVRDRFGKIHPATRTFQALRIGVNQELEELDHLLEDVLPSILRTGGRAAVLTFHSLEDRRVKRAFQLRESGWIPLFKKPLEADEQERSANPRSRSAKLRVAEWRAHEN